MRPPSGEADEPDLYAVLGVTPDADAAGIARAFRRGALTGHPDRGGDPAVFRDLQRARETLLDPVRRAAYDRRRAAAAASGPSDSHAPREPTSARGTGAADPFARSAGGGPSRARSSATRSSATRSGTADPFGWSPGAGQEAEGDDGVTGRAGFRARDVPSPAYDPGHSWRRADRFAWWEPDEEPDPERRRGRRGRGGARDREDGGEG